MSTDLEFFAGCDCGWHVVMATQREVVTAATQHAFASSIQGNVIHNVRVSKIKNPVPDVVTGPVTATAHDDAPAAPPEPAADPLVTCPECFREQRASVLAAHMERVHTFWLVWSPNGATPPTHRHESRDLAAYEAIRLARLHAGWRFYILRAFGYAEQPRDVREVAFDGEALPGNDTDIPF